MVSLTSPSGAVTVKEIEINGRNYHLPPWLQAGKFADAFETPTWEGDGLKYLKSCELDSWDGDVKGDWRSRERGPIFRLVFEVPFGEVTELVAGRFTPFLEDDLEPEILFEEEKIRLEFRAYEYIDSRAIDVLSFPKNAIPEHTESDWHDHFYLLHEDFEDHIEETALDGGHYTEFITEAGDEYFVLIQVHVD